MVANKCTSRPSLALVRELLAMVVDPRRSCNQAGQEADSGSQTAGNGPDLREARQAGPIVALIDYNPFFFSERVYT